MKDTELWIISGKLVDGNKVLKLELISNRQKETTIKYETFRNFYETHTVINAKPSENHITGLGINLNYLPTYKSTENGIVQVKGMSKQQVIQLALPLLNKYNEKINEDSGHSKPNDFTYELYKKIKDLIASGKYASVETTSLELAYKNDKKVLYAKLTEEDGKDTYIYTCADSGNNIVINRYKNNTKDSEILLGKETESIKIFMSMLSVVNIESYNRLESLEKSLSAIRESFEAYSGDSISIDGVLAEYKDIIDDEEAAAMYAFEASIMQLKYINLNKHVHTKYNGYLFRGQGKMPDKYINSGFTSLSTSINIASEFAGRGNECEVLVFTDISDGFLINMRNVAIYGIDNRQDNQIEYEILACNNLSITKGRRLGTINNSPIYLAKLNKEKDVPAINYFYKRYNYDSIYALRLLFDNLRRFNELIIDPFNKHDYTVRFEAKNFGINIDLGQKDIVINGRELSREEFNNFLLNHRLKADASKIFNIGMK